MSGPLILDAEAFSALAGQPARRQVEAGLVLTADPTDPARLAAPYPNVLVEVLP